MLIDDFANAGVLGLEQFAGSGYLDRLNILSHAQFDIQRGLLPHFEVDALLGFCEALAVYRQRIGAGLQSGDLVKPARI